MRGETVAPKLVVATHAPVPLHGGRARPDETALERCMRMRMRDRERTHHAGADSRGHPHQRTCGGGAGGARGDVHRDGDAMPGPGYASRGPPASPTRARPAT